MFGTFPEHVQRFGVRNVLCSAAAQMVPRSGLGFQMGACSEVWIWIDINLQQTVTHNKAQVGEVFTRQSKGMDRVRGLATTP